jgi:hypothetical protein
MYTDWWLEAKWKSWLRWEYTMKRIKAVLRWMGLASTLLTGAMTSYGQSCSTRSTGVNNYDYDAHEAVLKERTAEAKHEYDNALLQCKLAASHRACVTAAENKYEDELIRIAVQRNRNGADRSKAAIDAQSATDECNVTGETPALKEENRRHYEVQIDIKKEEVDAETGYKNAKLECDIHEGAEHSHDSGGAISKDRPTLDADGNYVPSRGGQGRGCVSDAEKQYASAKVKLQIKTNDENYTHDKNVAEIRKASR